MASSPIDACEAALILQFECDWPSLYRASNLAISSGIERLGDSVDTGSMLASYRLYNHWSLSGGHVSHAFPIGCVATYNSYASPNW